jgi:hypothetical protein
VVAGNSWQPRDAEVARLKDRMDNGLAAMAARIFALEQAGQAEVAGGQRRRERVWAIIVGLMLGVACPLAVTGIIAALHLR